MATRLRTSWEIPCRTKVFLSDIWTMYTCEDDQQFGPDDLTGGQSIRSDSRTTSVPDPLAQIGSDSQGILSGPTAYANLGNSTP